MMAPLIAPIEVPMTQFGSSADPQVAQLDQAVQSATQPSQRPGYLGVFDTAQEQGSPLDQLGSVIGGAVQRALLGLDDHWRGGVAPTLTRERQAL